MTSLEFVVNGTERASDGSLLPADVTRASQALLAGGFVLLPSDTSYSVAVLPLSGDTRAQLNLLLNRPDQPLSLAFPDIAAATRWAAPNPVATALLDHFSPGPITVVTKASVTVPVQVVDKALGGRNGTIGFRIPNSPAERSVASAQQYPITTTAVFVDDRPVTDYRTARKYIESRIALTTFERWGAIEGSIDFHDLSTVVRVTSDGRVDEVRAGAIPLSEIEARRSLILREQA